MSPKPAREPWIREDCCQCISPGDIICERCGVIFCAAHIDAHEHLQHARERYIEKIALGELTSCLPMEDVAEAEELKNKWQEQS